MTRSSSSDRPVFIDLHRTDASSMPDRVEDLRVVVAHDYLTQRGGAERVALSLMEAFPRARLLTSVYSPETTFEEFKKYRVETLWPNHFDFFRKDPRRALPVLAHAFSTHSVGAADVVISSTSGWAHGLPGGLPTVVYCHNPARWLYQTRDYFSGPLRPARRLFEHASSRMKEWDRRSAHSASVYFANSRAVKERIAETYGISAALLPPPAGLDAAGAQDPVPGLGPGFLLLVSRPRGYKNVAVACEAVASMPGVRMVVVGDLPPRSQGRVWPPSITALSGMSDAQMRWLYTSCAGVVGVAREDFGLTPVEGFSFGKPAALLRAGGYLDSGAPDIASVWIEEPTAEATRQGLQQLLSREWDTEAICRHAARFSREQFHSRLREAALSVVRESRRPRLVEGTGPNHGRRHGDPEDGAVITQPGPPPLRLVEDRGAAQRA